MVALGHSQRHSQRRIDALQAALIGCLLTLAAIAWLLTGRTMEGMDMGPGTGLGSLSFYVGAWVVMMAAMMFPSILPMVRTYALVQRSRNARRGLGEPVSAVAAFITGYLLTWTAFGLVAYAAFDLGRSLDIGAFSWDRGGPYLAGGVILAAAVYQLTPVKDACLSRCRGTLDFLLDQWRDGPLGALEMGVIHGAWCVGCCWALMASLFALGVMSLPWMIVVAALIAIEKLFPSKRIANRLVAGVLLVLGLGVALTPGSVPGLTLPNSPAAARAMQSMSGMHSRGAMPAPSPASHMRSPAMPMHAPSTHMRSSAMPMHAPSTHMRSSAMPAR